MGCSAICVTFQVYYICFYTGRVGAKERFFEMFTGGRGLGMKKGCPFGDSPECSEDLYYRQVPPSVSTTPLAAEMSWEEAWRLSTFSLI